MCWGENKTSLIEVINAEAIRYFRLKLLQIPSEMTGVTVTDMQRPPLSRRLHFVLQQNTLSLTFELIMGITKKGSSPQRLSFLLLFGGQLHEDLAAPSSTLTMYGLDHPDPLDGLWLLHCPNISSVVTPQYFGLWHMGKWFNVMGRRDDTDIMCRTDDIPLFYQGQKEGQTQGDSNNMIFNLLILWIILWGKKLHCVFCCSQGFFFLKSEMIIIIISWLEHGDY